MNAEDYGKTEPSITEVFQQLITNPEAQLGDVIGQIMQSLTALELKVNSLPADEQEPFLQRTQAELNMISFHPSELALLRPEPESLTEPEIVELLQAYRHSAREQVQYARVLLLQCSGKEVPEIHPQAEQFEFIKTMSDLAFYLSHPDTATPINEELSGWGNTYAINFESIDALLGRSLFRRRQSECLHQLGYARGNVNSSAILPITPYGLIAEDAFIRSLEQRYVQMNPRQQRQAQVSFWLSTFPFLKRFHCNCCGVIHVSKASPNHCDRCTDALGGEGDRPLEFLDGVA